MTLRRGVRVRIVVAAIAMAAVVGVGLLLNPWTKGESGVPPSPQTLSFHIASDKHEYGQGESVFVSSWFSNPGPEPVKIATYRSSCLLDVMVYDVQGSLVYNGTEYECLDVFVGDFVAQPGVDSPFQDWRWNQHYRIIKVAPDGSPLYFRTGEVVPPGDYRIVGRALGSSYESSAEFRIR